ncbi:replication factor C small subunit 2 [Natronococcus pandeyae]|uniref:Replication factor C small subunit n=1 Tax=Natronococcus pandeyae TaxID=2055836 RepID=A0A8J8TTE5_9EURY|nr:AAA family ATPase [Natronococcus pandeyae]TYL39592.1 replication factor C small subunit 2 [Natronococcus pandeyae]
MDAPLWTDTYAPELAELPQDDAREYLERAVEEPINLVLQGPPGSGKTAAARALAHEAHDDPDNDLVEINVADFFGRTKTEIKNDPRFASFLTGRSSMSKRDMINRVLKESASYAPVSGEYKTILLDNAEDVREDFQQALRRIMEQHHRTTQFVIATRQPTKLIPPIRSRCFPVSLRAPTSEETVTVLERIVEAEEVEYDRDGLEFVAGYANGNLRQAILAAQTTVEDEGELTMSAAYETIGEVGLDDEIESMLDDAEAGEFTDARSTLDDLLVDEGLDGQEVVDEMLRIARKRYQGDRLARVHRLAGDIEFEMHEGTSDRIHVSHLLAELGRNA